MARQGVRAGLCPRPSFRFESLDEALGFGLIRASGRMMRRMYGVPLGVGSA